MPKPTNESSTPIEWGILFNSLIVLTLTLILGIALIMMSLQYQQYIKAWKSEQNRTLNKFEGEYWQLQEAIEVVDNLYLDKFSQLKAQGFFFNNPKLAELRLDISEAIKQLLSQMQVQKRLIGASYQLLERQVYVPSIEFNPNDELKTYETKIILKLKLLHEEDVLKSIETIEFQQYTGFFNLKRCQIKRLREKISLKEISKINFEAECVLAWYISKIETE